MAYSVMTSCHEIDLTAEVAMDLVERHWEYSSFDMKDPDWGLLEVDLSPEHFGVVFASLFMRMGLVRLVVMAMDLQLIIIMGHHHLLIHQVVSFAMDLVTTLVTRVDLASKMDLAIMEVHLGHSIG